MADTTTTALRKAGIITDLGINAAFESVMGGERPGFPIAKGYTLDIP